MQNLQSKLAVVTGGGSGIGLAFVKIICEAGCDVIIADLALHQDAKIWLETIPARPRVEFLQTDVTVRAQLERIFDYSEREFGTCPDIVVPGAGVYEPSSNSFWEDGDPGPGYKVLDINLVHPIKLSRIAIRSLVQRKKSGTIIMISSIAGQRSSIVTPLYTASKHGINSFIRGMSQLHELADIRVVGVAPGTVGTPLFTEHPEAAKFLDMDKDFLLEPNDVARAMFCLLTKDTYKSGTVLEVCDPMSWREVSLLNDPGPSGLASFTRKKNEALNDIIKHLTVDDAPVLSQSFVASTD